MVHFPWPKLVYFILPFTHAVQYCLHHQSKAFYAVFPANFCHRDSKQHIFLLSHSRYKYAQCQSRPFTAVDLVTACHNCFRYWGGMPREMVFDQDSIVCVSENSGDIIYTYEFEKFRQDCRMEATSAGGRIRKARVRLKIPLSSLKAISSITVYMWMTRF